MKEGGLVSVIVPVYNTEPYLRKCIDSIIKQTYSNIEIILVNDGSTDKSGFICTEYANHDHRVHIINQCNKGVSAARNQGLEVIKGKYVCFIDSDDYVHKEMISIMMDLASEHNADMVVCDYSNVVQDIDEIFPKEGYFELLLSNIQALNKLNSDLRIHMTVMWNKLYRRELFENHRFPVGKLYEDEYLCYKLIHKSKRIFLTNKKLYYHLKRNDSIMGKGFNIERLRVLDAFEERAEYFFQHGLKEMGIYASDLYMRSIIKYFDKLSRSRQMDKELFNGLVSRFRNEYKKREIFLRGLQTRERMYLYMFRLNPVFSRILFSIWVIAKRKIKHIVK